MGFLTELLSPLGFGGEGVCGGRIVTEIWKKALKKLVLKINKHGLSS